MTMRIGAKDVSRLGALMLLAGMVGSIPVAASAQEKTPEAASAAPKKTGQPTFVSAWKISLPADTRRAAVADILEEGKPRLLTLNMAGTLTVHKVVEGKPQNEASIALGKDAAKFVVGHFAKGKPALIVAPGGTFYWDKDKFVQKPAPEGKGVPGSLRLKDGSEAFLLFTEGETPVSYIVDLATPSVYKAGPDVPQPKPQGSSLREIVIDFPTDFFESAPFPAAVKKGSIARIFDPRGEDKLYGLFAWQTVDGPYVAVVDGGSVFPGPRPDAMPVWKSAKLAGTVLDIALGPDVQGTKRTGFYVLQEAGGEKKERILEFFALE